MTHQSRSRRRLVSLLGVTMAVAVVAARTVPLASQAARVSSPPYVFTVLEASASQAARVSSPPYVFTVLEASPTGCCSAGKGINNLGQVVGDYYVGPTGPNHSFIYEAGLYTTFDLPFGASGNGFNDAGDIVGPSFLYSGGTFTIITVPFAGAIFTNPRDINNKGEIVGEYIGADQETHGFLRDANGGFVSFDFPGSFQTSANGINDAGLIVGEYAGSGFQGNRGFVRNVDGTFMTFDVPLADTTSALHGVNNSGQFVGFYADLGLNTLLHGFVGDVNGNFLSIDPPLSLRTVPRGINDTGQITGDFLDGATGLTHGFIATASVENLLSVLISAVESLNLQAGITRSFDVKLDAVVAALDDLKDQNDLAAVNGMYAFIHAVEAQRGVRLTDAKADSLISMALTIINVLTG
jgi:uncharacterized membrane protein